MIDSIRLEAHLNNGKTEYILCSAIHIDNGKDYVHKPFNIDKGYVMCGWRHHNILEIIPLEDKRNKDIITTQGFLTNKNRFINRKEALELAKSNGQVNSEAITLSELYSEDLW